MSDKDEKQQIPFLKDAAASTRSFHGLPNTANGHIGPYKLVSTLGEGGFVTLSSSALPTLTLA